EAVSSGTGIERLVQVHAVAARPVSGRRRPRKNECSFRAGSSITSLRWERPLTPTPASRAPASCGRGGVAEQAEISPGRGGAREGGALGGVISRRDRDEVEADEGQSREAAQDRLRLPAREPADLRRARARREGGVEHVDIETEIDRRIAHD